MSTGEHPAFQLARRGQRSGSSGQLEHVSVPDARGDRAASAARRLEHELARGLDRGFIEAVAHRLDCANLRHLPRRVDRQLEIDLGLQARRPGCRGVGRVNEGNQPGRRERAGGRRGRPIGRFVLPVCRVAEHHRQQGDGGAESSSETRGHDGLLGCEGGRRTDPLQPPCPRKGAETRGFLVAFPRRVRGHCRQVSATLDARHSAPAWSYVAESATVATCRVS